MAVVIKYAASYKDPAALNTPNVSFMEGKPRGINTKAVAIANGDSANSKIYFGKMPSSAIPDLKSLLYHDGLTSLNDFDIGVELEGAVVSVALFADGLDLTTAGTKSVFANVSRANAGKRVWELLGLTVDPNVEYDVVATLKIASGAAGNVAAQIDFYV